MPESFIHRIEKIILANIENEKFGVSELAAETGLSRSQVLRKIKSLTGKSANHLIREIRLGEAAKLILHSDLTASEIAYKVGFSSPSYFNKCFLDHFGLTPGEYRKKSDEGELQEFQPQKTGSNKKLIGRPVFFLFLLLTIAVIVTLFILNSENIAETKKTSIAVLPFSDYSETQDKEYLADGLTENINLELAKNKSLRVISRGSAMKYKNTKMLYPDIAKELGADLLLEGSLFSTHDSVRVVVQLIEPFPKEKHIWENNYDQDHSNYFSLVRNVSAEIAGEISSAVQPAEPGNKYTVTPEAYELYLRGKHIFNYQKTSDSTLLKAINYLTGAIQINPEFAPAYVTLAETYLALNSLIGDNEQRLKNREAARIAIDKALELDQTLAEAYITKANIAGKADWDWERMKNLAEKGLEFEPSNSNAHITLSDYYAVQGNYRKAINEVLKAEVLDPVNPAVGYKVAKLYYIAGDCDKSIQKYNDVIELNPNYGWAYDGLGFAYFQKGDLQNSVKWFQKLQYDVLGNNALGDCYSNQPFEECLQFFIDNARNKTPRFCANPLIIAQVFMMLNDRQGAMDFINIAFQYKNEDLPVMITYPDFNPLRSNPEFQKIAQKVGVIFKIN